MLKKSVSKFVVGSLVSSCMLASVAAVADIPLPPQDSFVTTIVDKSVIHGSLAHDAKGNLIYDKNGNARFQYKGLIYSVGTNSITGELTDMEQPIGHISGEAAFPKQFVALSAGVNSVMDAINAGLNVTMPPMPAVVPWTCNHCDMVAGGTHYISIVDALDPTLSDGTTPNPNYNIGGIADKFNAGLIGGADAALSSMKMDGRAFTGFGPASFDPVARTMSVRMAGCSALVAIDGLNAGKIGTLCMNATATFDVSGAIASFDANGNLSGYDPTSSISADGSSNCITVLQPVQ